MGTTLRHCIDGEDPFSFTDREDQAHAFIDFSAVAALEKNVEIAALRKKPIVIGTTGHGSEIEKKLKDAAREIPIFFSANFSLGVALCVRTLQFLKNNLPKDTQIEMVETHHKSKRDAPSGTALMLARPLDLRSDSIVSHRVDKAQFIHETSLSFGSETIILKHESFSREVYARGALRAAGFLLNQKPGFYTMEALIHEQT